MQLERVIEALDEEWRTGEEFDTLLARLLRVPKSDTMSVPTTRVALDGFAVLRPALSHALELLADAPTEHEQT